MTDTTTRYAELKAQLSQRRFDMQEDVLSRIRDGRSSRSREVHDDLEHSDADAQEDLDLALLQMRSETLTRIDEALVRLEAGQYGSCRECGTAISERRLQALPFAVRCQACEERREHEQGRERMAQRRGGSGFSVLANA